MVRRIPAKIPADRCLSICPLSLDSRRSEQPRVSRYRDKYWYIDGYSFYIEMWEGYYTHTADPSIPHPLCGQGGCSKCNSCVIMHGNTGKYRDYSGHSAPEQLLGNGRIINNLDNFRITKNLSLEYWKSLCRVFNSPPGHHLKSTSYLIFHILKTENYSVCWLYCWQINSSLY